MKLAPLLLINLATVAVGIAAYDALRAEPAPQEDAAVMESADTRSLARRLDTLEARSRPVLAAPGIDPHVRERLDRLDAALQALAEPRHATQPDDDAEAIPVAVPTGDPLAPGAGGADPTAQELARFRRMSEVVRKQDKIAKERARLDARLNKLPFRVAGRQRDEIYAAHAAFEPRIQEIWTQVKQDAQATVASGGRVDRREIMASTQATIQRAFATELEAIVPAADAEQIAQALMPHGK